MAKVNKPENKTEVKTLVAGNATGGLTVLKNKEKSLDIMSQALGIVLDLAGYQHERVYDAFGAQIPNFEKRTLDMSILRSEDKTHQRLEKWIKSTLGVMEIIKTGGKVIEGEAVKTPEALPEPETVKA